MVHIFTYLPLYFVDPLLINLLNTLIASCFSKIFDCAFVYPSLSTIIAVYPFSILITVASSSSPTGTNSPFIFLVVNTIEAKPEALNKINCDFVALFLPTVTA